MLYKLKKHITPLILVFALFAINGSEFLHHHDYASNIKDNHCQACLINKTLQSVSIEKSDINLNSNLSYEPFPLTENNLPQKDFTREFSGRSPPSASHI
ncbi:MAG: hypothetical protein L0Y79_00640 [Chlorobi bacterium]|nr:hypothetical protein [Chlorobiota bacterium]MCI0715534.1 hypothetical protein [Chlorobiota bacterium]